LRGGDERSERVELVDDVHQLLVAVVADVPPAVLDRREQQSLGALCVGSGEGGREGNKK